MVETTSAFGGIWLIAAPLPSISARLTRKSIEEQLTKQLRLSYDGATISNLGSLVMFETENNSRIW
jgi:hypothetical protein